MVRSRAWNRSIHTPAPEACNQPLDRRAVMITTSPEFSRWGGSMFGDDQMAAAVIDCVVHHGRLVQFRGEFYRVRHDLMQEGRAAQKRVSWSVSKLLFFNYRAAQFLLTKRSRF